MSLNAIDGSPVLGSKWVQLGISIFLDILGMLNLILPVLGDILFDIPTAVLNLTWIELMANEETFGHMMAIIGFLEELGPYLTDIVPSCTLTWIMKWYTDW